MAITTALKKIEKAVFEPTFYKIIQGGQGAGKTFAIMTTLIGYAMSYAESLISVVGMSYRHLDQGAIRDFKNIMKEACIWECGVFNNTRNTYTFPNGSIIEFLSADNMSARGPRRDVLFVNEINGSIDYETFGQLSGRTNDFVIVDYNPSSEFYIHTKILNDPVQKKRTSFLILTYKDNQALSETEREYIESRAPRNGEKPSNWYIVYGLGQIGSLEGNVYEGWCSVPKIPEGFILKRYGVDFGWNDPTAVVAVYENDNNELLFDQILYQSKLPTAELVEKLGKLPPALMVCDSARPEIISDIRSAGIQAIGCDKSTKSPDGKIDNVLWGINLVQKRTCYYTQASKDLEREYLTYAWRKKKSGEVLDVPEDSNNHILDALRYCTLDLERKPIEYATPR